MSELPGFTKLTSTTTKFRDLEMEDTFLQNLQVMNGGSNNFNLEDSLLTFQRNVVNEGVSLGSKIEIGTLTAEDEDSSIRMQKSTNDVVAYETIIKPHQYFVEFNNPEEESEPITTNIFPGGIGIQIYDYETEQYYGTQPVLLNEQGKIDAQYLPENPIGITKASDMNQATFWDADVVVPTGYTLTNTDGIPGEQITSGYISASRINNLSAGKITSGTFNVDRIPDLNANKITAGTFDVGRIPDLAMSKIKDLETTLEDYVTTSALTTTLENYVESSALSDYVTSSSLTTILSDYVEDSDLSTTLSSYVTSTTLETTLAGYASLDDDQKISINAIPDLNADKISDIDKYVLATDLTDTLKKYASLDQNNQISVDAIPNLKASKITEGTFALERIPDLTTSKISDIETSYAKLSEGKISDSVIPDLSSTYAKLTNNKISENAIPDLSSTYASLTNSKISTSVIPNLGSSAGMTIDASLITNAPWKSSIKLSEMEIDQDLNMNEYSIIVGTTSSGKTAIYNKGLQTVTGDGDIYNLFNGDLVVDSITPAGLKLNVYGDLKLSSNHNIQTTGKITASTIDATMNLSKITIDTDLNLGDKNLTTTGTVTASNIPNST